ncbi:glycosyl transferase family 2 [Rodentibacter caecimuris]|uniref:Glycosyl transferase family 2 n=1 Tax=Rodentibacter caecimuris TaxID=1796644 RepID=A0AAJ3K2X2_9PAST|nr:glycosyl transferase family 2 [Rodentibacter heylii]AOF52973.1 Lysophospholipid acyltransferase [Pasteurellaceae bacterium NI1060]MCQ9123685.1 glycosyl transferase family 2 [Rodentibacter heylii]OOF71429.1 glycosyl transferase family 2 [Rodentibacter heylii]OOF76211.1 glycosyl transferase family 2 [Rodentibacter heylii]OOF77100.1 glycosyl transferase family 2 [Rodentibacter heylii]
MSEQHSQHWAKQQERGNHFFLNLTRLIVQYLPLFAIRVVTFFVVCYFFATSKNTRKNIRTYQYNLSRNYPKVKLPTFSVFRQFLAFGESITDRFAVWQHKMTYKDLTVDDADNLYQDIRASHQHRGQLLVCSHFGNIEVCRSLVGDGHHPNFRLNVLVHSRHAEAFNRALVKAGASELSLIQVEDLDAQKMLELHERLERGEWIAIAADRIPVRGDKMAKINFLGQEADFPQGVWFLASLLKAPINTVFCLKEQGRYRLKLRRFCPQITGRGKEREENIRQAMQQYADCLAKECEANPLLWFNFYDFWKKSE